MFSTVDICAVDLIPICDFLKAGASSTFNKKRSLVESIASENLAAGLVQQLDFDTASRKLYHGDYLIMMTDGVLDALPTGTEEENQRRDHYGCPGKRAQGDGTGNTGKGPGIQ